MGSSRFGSLASLRRSAATARCDRAVFRIGRQASFSGVFAVDVDDPVGAVDVADVEGDPFFRSEAGFGGECDGVGVSRFELGDERVEVRFAEWLDFAAAGLRVFAGLDGWVAVDVAPSDRGLKALAECVGVAVAAAVCREFARQAAMSLEACSSSPSVHVPNLWRAGRSRSSSVLTVEGAPSWRARNRSANLFRVMSGLGAWRLSRGFTFSSNHWRASRLVRNGGAWCSRRLFSRQRMPYASHFDGVGRCRSVLVPLVLLRVGDTD